MRIFIICLLILASFPACKEKKPDVLAVNLDQSVDPSKDFFMYANGGWIKKNPIPAERGSWTIGHLVLEENQNRLRTISEEAAKKKATRKRAAKKK